MAEGAYCCCNRGKHVSVVMQGVRLFVERWKMEIAGEMTWDPDVCPVSASTLEVPTCSRPHCNCRRINGSIQAPGRCQILFRTTPEPRRWMLNARIRPSLESSLRRERRPPQGSIAAYHPPSFVCFQEMLTRTPGQIFALSLPNGEIPGPLSNLVSSAASYQTAKPPSSGYQASFPTTPPDLRPRVAAAGLGTAKHGLASSPPRMPMLPMLVVAGLGLMGMHVYIEV